MPPQNLLLTGRCPRRGADEELAATRLRSRDGSVEHSLPLMTFFVGMKLYSGTTKGTSKRLP